MSERMKNRQQQILAEFRILDDWEDRYGKIIEIGKSLPELPEAKKNPEALVKGCQSRVWMHARITDRQEVEIEADSDALIVKGLVALLLRLYSESTPEEILETKPTFITDLGLHGHLSPSRANGLNAMLKQIMFFAMAFQAYLKRKSEQIT